MTSRVTTYRLKMGTTESGHRRSQRRDLSCARRPVSTRSNAGPARQATSTSSGRSRSPSRRTSRGQPPRPRGRCRRPRRAPEVGPQLDSLNQLICEGDGDPSDPAGSKQCRNNAVLVAIRVFELSGQARELALLTALSLSMSPQSDLANGQRRAYAGPAGAKPLICAERRRNYRRT